METIAKRLTLKFGFIQSSYWISQCAINSFAAVYLHAKHFENTQIGFILSFAAILSMLFQPLVASFADKSKKITLRYMMLTLMFMVLGLGLLLYLLPNSFLFITVIYILINAIEYTLNPLFNSLAMEYMNQGVPMNYGLGRGIGSIAFAVMSLALGFFVDTFGADVILPVFLLCYLFVIFSTCLFEEKLPAFSKEQKVLFGITEPSGKETEKESSSLLAFFVSHKAFMVMLLGIAMLFYSHILINTFLINIMENVGGGSSDMGLSLSIAATLELPTMALFILIVRKVKGSTLIKISALFFTVKSLLTMMAANVALVHVSMSLQLLSFALFTPASIYYVNDLIEKENRVKGQSMLGVANIGIAGTLANLTGGRLLDTYGVEKMLLVGTVVTAIGFILICFSVREPAKESEAVVKQDSCLDG
ncbi:MFS transporter [Anaerocolumna xylanovorans]|uniref:MFS transporter, PPP family, 3-phenylpropionic acid transporter n=1 Tax=Anaerocolumna xylanovorans DSM 12503 TaxID=1121345 RepID=A0A1M7Y969_9FIRM|nr:MFS transporter [Anaerocolumna xylanovorans]SHO49183.1 MFS transporter, PPP family, 3-phenylpropionic acid transporter [Anaerocolumna xylanovorans DSM 12503]